MEEPDGATGSNIQMKFTAEQEVSPTPTLSKKEQLKAAVNRFKTRKATPRPIVKGDGNKRFSLTPSPAAKQASKKSFTGDKIFQGAQAGVKKRNLLSDLNAAASEEPKEDATSSVVLGEPTGDDVAICEDKLSGDDVSDEGNDQQFGHGSIDTKSEGEGRPEIGTQKNREERDVGMLTSTVQADCDKGTKANLPVEALGTSPYSFGNGTKDPFLTERNVIPILANQPSRDYGESCWSMVNKSFVAGDDNGLDLAATQPLQAPISILKRPSSGEKLIPVNRVENGTTSKTQPETPRQINPASHATTMEVDPLLDSNFPPLPKGRIWNMVRNLERGGTTSSSEKGENSGSANANFSNVTPIPTPSSPGRPPSMADMLRRGTSEPQNREPVPFQLDQIKKMGAIRCLEGKHSIAFSTDDSKFLADKMEHTVVGKFSHSIPSSSQIQKALDNMNLVGTVTWAPINAKHIAIYLEDATDYATLLVGQNGLPVWNVERHPMRVFKWTPSFDPYFETPIAAVWCNLIGLPIHLFEKSALFAIGRIFGNPIQIDHATAAKTRLSFARISVEIDISKPQPEEFVIDMMGKEVVQKVRWDKIPLYCGECKHVGHISANCHAHLHGERKPRNGYFNHNYSYQQPRNQFENHLKRGGGTAGAATTSENPANVVEVGSTSNGKGLGYNHGQGNNLSLDNEGFIKQGRRRGGKQKNKKGKNIIHRSNSQGQALNLMDKNKGVATSAGIITSSIPGQADNMMQIGKEQSKREEVLMKFSKPSYFTELENGIFGAKETDQDTEMDGNIEHHLVIEGSSAKPPDKEGVPYMGKSTVAIVSFQEEEGSSLLGSTLVS